MSGTDELRDQLRREMSTGVPGWRGGGDGEYWQLKVDRILALPAVVVLLKQAEAWRATAAVIDDGAAAIVEGNDAALGDRS